MNIKLLINKSELHLEKGKLYEIAEDQEIVEDASGTKKESE